MKILMINPRYDEYNYRYRVNKIAPPLGMAYISRILRDEGHEVRILDMEAEAMEFTELPAYLEGDVPDLVGIHGTTPICGFIAECARIVRNECPKTVIVVGGAHATLLPQSVLTEMPAVDYILRGEAEFTFRDLVRSLKSGLSSDGVSKIPGIGFRRNGGFFVSDEISRVDSLDDIPFPAYDLLPLDIYFGTNRLAETGADGKSFTMMSSRGCPFSCIFCSAPVLYGHKFRARSASNIVDEMAYLNKKYGITHIIFYDASFMCDSTRVEQICSEILNRGLSVSWRVRARADRLTRPLAQLMKKAGCTTIALGVETGTQRMLDIINKRTTISAIEEAFRVAKECDLWTVGYFMLGIPGETKEDAQRTIDFAKELDPDWALFTTATPLPGTKMYEMAKENLVTEDWMQYKFSANSPVVSYEHMNDDELRQLLDHAFTSFYLRKEWLLGRLKKADTETQTERIVNSFFDYYDNVKSRI